jgi:hypothetical protein
MTSRILLVGESNPYGSDPEFALYCYPPGCAGHRLFRILGLPEDQYLGLHRTNLCAGEWSTVQAKDRVWELLSPQAPWNVIVLLGRKVTESFQKVALEDVPLVAFSTRVCCPGMTLVSLPHPSGRNASQWNPKARARVREIMREVAPELPWGSADDTAKSVEEASA